MTAPHTIAGDFTPDRPGEARGLAYMASRRFSQPQRVDGNGAGGGHALPGVPAADHLTSPIAAGVYASPFHSPETA
jgi:hypothetical protein